MILRLPAGEVEAKPRDATPGNNYVGLDVTEEVTFNPDLVKGQDVKRQTAELKAAKHCICLENGEDRSSEALLEYWQEVTVILSRVLVVGWWE